MYTNWREAIDAKWFLVAAPDGTESRIEFVVIAAVVADAVVVVVVEQPIGFDCGVIAVVVVAVAIDVAVAEYVERRCATGHHWRPIECDSGGQQHRPDSGPCSGRCSAIWR